MTEGVSGLERLRFFSSPVFLYYLLQFLFLQLFELLLCIWVIHIISSQEIEMLLSPPIKDNNMLPHFIYDVGMLNVLVFLGVPLYNREYVKVLRNCLMHIMIDPMESSGTIEIEFSFLEWKLIPILVILLMLLCRKMHECAIHIQLAF